MDLNTIIMNIDWSVMPNQAMRGTCKCALGSHMVEYRFLIIT